MKLPASLKLSINNQKGFAPILLIGVIVVVIIGATGLILYQRHTSENKADKSTADNNQLVSNTEKDLTSINSPSPLQANSPRPLPTKKLETKGLKTFKNHYGEYQVQIPANWEAVNCPGEGNSEGCTIITPEKDNFLEILTVNVSLADVSKSKKSANFNIPSLGNTLNSHLEKEDQKESITFRNKGVEYTIIADSDQTLELDYLTDGLETILKQIATSITFLNEPFSCKDQTLNPLTFFPDNFVLYNYHDSDNSDPVYSYWPYTKKKDDSKYLIEDAKKNSKRGFMVHYVKSGTSFTDVSFSSKVTEIHGSKDAYGFNEDKTGLWHLNCVDTQEDGPGIEIPYHIGSDDNDLFALHLYGYASNPQALWGVQKWNVKLLKSVRNEVYARLGTTWQKYTASDYFATMPTQYGGKPAIYLYPTHQQSVKVEIHPRGQLTKTDKLYDPLLSGWQVTAGINGVINDTQNYLYYEAMLPVPIPEHGYIVPYSQLFNFSKNYVKELGLNDIESEEFVSFWKSKLPKSLFYFVSHLDQETIAQIYPLKISPSPETLIRVELYFKPLSQKINISQPRKPILLKRIGFTAVEWGGILDQDSSR